MNKYAVIVLSMILGLHVQTLSANDNPQIIEFRKPQVDIFNSTGTEWLEKVDTATIGLPVPVLKTLKSGFFVIKLDGEERAVRRRAVRSDYVYTMTSKCSNQLSVNKAGVSRGLGDGEC